jgi:glutamine amidotransferase
MCLAIYKPKGVEISKAYYRNGYSENRDGCGFAFARNGRIECYKGFTSFSDFWQAIKPLQGKHAMLVHFRFATHGDKTTSNVHPILIANGKIAVIHNGVIPIKTTGNDSDTVTFARDVLAPCFKRFSWRDATLKYLVETSIGSGNKIVALNAQGDVVIFNEASGHWHKGSWYSNHGYEGTKRWWSQCNAYASACVSRWSTKEKSDSTIRYYKQDVFDEIDSDEIEAECLKQAHANLGIPDMESSNTLDYSGKSSHLEPLRPLIYYKFAEDGKGGLVEDK